MNLEKRLSKILCMSNELTIDNNSKIIIMSDCHRGDGSVNDNFSNNKTIYCGALLHYLNDGYTYIELGDGDELWEHSNYYQILSNHIDVFKLISAFYKDNRFYMLFGNHDITKKSKFIQNYVLREYYDEPAKKYIKLFPYINVSEGLVLKYKDTKDKILLVHGHQGDLLNDTCWKLSRFLVRYFWKPLELIGIRNPTSAATNDFMKNHIEKKLIDWSIKNKQMIIAGHTHRTCFPNVGEHLYVNDGCCTYPHYITGIEINGGSILLVKWSIKAREDQTLFVDKEVISGPIKLKEYFNKKCF